MAESITLQTSDNNVQQSDVLGRLSFAASNESSGSDSRLIGASIYASAESDFTAISNATSLIFATASSENATERMRINSVGSVGIATALPEVKLQINAAVVDDNNYVYDTNALMVTHQTPTSATVLNDPKDVLYLARQGTSGQAFGAAAAFSLSRYENSSVNARTRLDIDLSHGSYLNSKTKVLTMLSNGNVGIGESSPSSRLDVEGGDVVFNDNGGNFDFRVEGDTDPNLLFVDASVDDVGIGTNTPAAKLHVAGDTLFENLSYRRFTTSTAIATHFRKYYDIAHYANSVSTVAGSLRIEIPVTTSTMWSMDVVIVEYDGVNGNNIKTTNLTITGYTTTNLNRGVWTNNPSRINQVRFGRKSGGGSTIILIDPTSTFRYPKAYIKEINTHHSNETTFSNSANYSITITSDETDFILNGTITNDQFIRDDKLVNTFGNQTVSGNKTFDGNVIINETGGNFDFRVEGDTDQYLLFTDASVDRVAIGTASMNGKFNVTDSSTNTSNRYLNYFYGSHTSSANGAYYVFGDNINVYKLVNSGITDTGYAMGSEIVSVLNGNGTLTSTYGLRTYAGIHTGSSAGTNTVAYGVQSRVINFGSGSSLIGEARGVDIYINGDLGNNKTSAGITTAKALNIGTILDATNKWAIYQEGDDDKNYLNGSVGIGTSPVSKLHVLSAKDAAYGNFFIQDSTASAAGVGASIIFGGKYTSGGAYARFGEIKAIKENSTDGNYDSALVFSTNDMSTLGERVRIDHNGNVGIGTSSPLYKLDVNGTFSANSVNVNDEYTFPTIDGSSGQALITDGSGNVSWTNIALNQTVNGRLTLESGVPFSTTNQSNKTTLYFSSYLGNQIALYNGTEWKIYNFSELSLSLSGYTANTNYDIFIYDNAGTLTLESVAWTNATTRATSLSIQDGVYVKSGATTRRYLGTIRTTETTGQCTDSTARRLVWNLYNQRIRLLNSTISGTHTYATSTWRAYDNNTTLGQGFAEFVLGLTTETNAVINAQLKYGYVGLGLDSTSTPTNNSVVHDGTNAGSGFRGSGFAMVYVSEGYHYYQIIELGLSASSTYYFAQQTSYIRG